MQPAGIGGGGLGGGGSGDAGGVQLPAGALLPVYDMTGRPLGYYPLAPG
jgi:hypothetical protein